MDDQFDVVRWYHNAESIAAGWGARLALRRRRHRRALDYLNGERAASHNAAPAQVARATKRRERMLRHHGRTGEHG